MKCYVYIDFSLVADGRTVGFSTGRIERSAPPAIGQFLRIGEPGDADGVKSEFLVTQIIEPEKGAPENEGISWIVTCDDNFFSSRQDIQKTVEHLERCGFVFDELIGDK